MSRCSCSRASPRCVRASGTSSIRSWCGPWRCSARGRRSTRSSPIRTSGAPRGSSCRSSPCCCCCCCTWHGGAATPPGRRGRDDAGHRASHRRVRALPRRAGGRVRARLPQDELDLLGGDLPPRVCTGARAPLRLRRGHRHDRSEEHTSELQSLAYLVCRLLLEKKKNTLKKLTEQERYEHHPLAYLV